MKIKKQSLLSHLSAKREIIPGIARLDFEWRGPPPLAGQFFLVKPARSSVFLARPLSAAGCSNDTVYFLAAVRGRGTAELTAMCAGEDALVTGPLGKGWSDFVPKNAGKPLALISGGLGLAPLAALHAELLKDNFNNFDFFAGFRRGADGEKLLSAVEGGLSEAIIVSEDESVSPASNGRIFKQGLVTDFLEAEKYAAVFSCGPAPMLRSAALRCRKAGIPCFVSLEKRMACGTGACLGCSLPVRGGGFKSCCADGPVFDAAEVFFDA
ncbi:MAG: dihydroorotate dehydrogenase electron transfer subunit [Spirochaetaceae bacterium]|jgi:NAD(P)H-flavin reductase|nr:dihydroorotate dehydrogenase electron transfer subunit [Spirochaetaceae bacterium]